MATFANGIAMFELVPHYENRKSYYGKAVVETCSGEGGFYLYSYGTEAAFVSSVEREITLTWAWDYSATTLRHVREFLAQYADAAFAHTSKRDIARALESGELHGFSVLCKA